MLTVIACPDGLIVHKTRNIPDQEVAKLSVTAILSQRLMGLVQDPDGACRPVVIWVPEARKRLPPDAQRFLVPTARSVYRDQVEDILAAGEPGTYPVLDTTITLTKRNFHRYSHYLLLCLTGYVYPPPPDFPMVKRLTVSLGLTNPPQPYVYPANPN